METNEDGNLSVGAIAGIILAVFSGLLCLCKCLADDEEVEQEWAKPELPDAEDNNHEEEEHEQAKTKPPEAIKLGVDKNQKLLDNVWLGAMIQMVLANKSNGCHWQGDLCNAKKLCGPPFAADADSDYISRHFGTGEQV